MGPWKRLGPALRAGPLPVVGVTVSLCGHVILLGLLALLGLWAQSNQTKVYVVNLVPGVAGPRPTPPPALPPMPASPRLPAEPPELPPLPAMARPAPQPPPLALPRREEPKPTLPPRLVESSRDLPSRTSRVDERAQATERPSQPAEPRQAARQPVPSGGQGQAAVTAEVSDFPFAWYLRRVQLKVAERWAEQPRISEPAQRPLIFVEILRDGSIKPPRLEKSSGNLFYDQAALRAIAEASPFPPLPQEWTRPSLRVLFGFDVQASRG